MNESDLELLVSQFLDGIRRAFSEVGKKGAAEHSTVMEYLSRAIIEADKIKCENTSKQEHVAHVAVLKQQLETQIKKVAEAGAPDDDRVLKKIHTSPAAMDIVAQLRHELADIGVAHMTHNAVKQQKKLAAVVEDDRQGKFHEMDEFRSVPKMILYLDPLTGNRIPVPYVKSREVQRVSSIAQHNSKSAQEKRLAKIEEEANKVLEPLVKEYGDLDPPELIARKLRDDKRRGGHRSA